MILSRSKEVRWSLISKKDSRWDNSGITIVAMMFQTAPKAKIWIKRCEKKYGEIPKDLEYHAYVV